MYLPHVNMQGQPNVKQVFQIEWENAEEHIYLLMWRAPLATRKCEIMCYLIFNGPVLQVDTLNCLRHLFRQNVQS